MTLVALYVALALIAGSLIVLGVCLRIRENRAGKHRWAWTDDYAQCRRCGEESDNIYRLPTFGCPGRKGKKR